MRPPNSLYNNTAPIPATAAMTAPTLSTAVATAAAPVNIVGVALILGVVIVPFAIMVPVIAAEPVPVIDFVGIVMEETGVGIMMLLGYAAHVALGSSGQDSASQMDCSWAPWAGMMVAGGEQR
jgi:hypothetical protein